MQTLRLTLIMLLMLIAAVPLAAEETVMKQVVVTATRFEEAVSTVPANVTVVTEEEIGRSPAATVPELLRSVPGVLVSDVTGNGRSYNVDLRGFGETGLLNTLVLVDGRRINVADISGVDWTLIPKDRVARIEIVRGGRGSVLYGDNAAGGVINIITKQGSDALQTTGNLSVGSYATTRGDGSVSGSYGDLTFALNGSYLNSDGYRENSDTLARDLGLNLGYAVTDRFSVRVSGGYHEDETGMPGRLTGSDLAHGVDRTETLFPDDFADTRDWYLLAGSQYFITDNSYLDLAVAQRDREADSFNVLFGFDFLGRTELDVLSVAPKLVFNERLFGRETRVLVGFDYEESELDVFSGSIFSTSNHELSKESYGYYLHGELFFTETFAVSAGARRDRAEYDFRSIETGITGDNAIDEDLFTAGVNYRFAADASVYASYAKSFRNPNLDEMFDRFTNSVDIGLQAQTSDDYEFGIRFSPAPETNIGINLFRIETEDEIFYDPAFFSNMNLDGKSLRQGLEVSLSKAFDAILLTGSYKFTDTDIDGGPYDGNDLPFVPKHQATIGAEAECGDHIRLGLDGTYVGKRRFISDFENSDDYLESYVYLTGKLSYLLENGSVYLAVNNLLDEEYSEYGTSPTDKKAYYPSPKINVRVGVDFIF